MKLLAIDGNSLVNRAYYGVRGLTAADGTPTNALVGFLNMLHKLLEQYEPQGVCVCFDMRAKTFRHLQYDGYKATRKGMPEELAVQMPLVKEVLDLLGIPRMEQEGYEADDLLGTLARLSHEQGHDCVIVTGDRDSLQYIAQGATVSLITTKMGQNITEDYDTALFAEKYQGLTPDKIVDLKAIMGDTSDNIPGVPGIGEKGAMALLTKFGTLDGVYENIDDGSITAATRKKLEAGKDSAYLSYKLALGEIHAPVDRMPGDLLLGKRDGEGLSRFFLRLDLQSQLKRWSVEPTEAVPADAGWQPGPFDRLENGKALRAIAPETRATVMLTRDNSAFAVCWEDRCALFTEEAPDYTETLEHLLTGVRNIPDCKRALLTRPGLGAPAFDIELAAYLLQSTGRDFSVKACAGRYLGALLGDPDFDAEDAHTLFGLTEEAGERLAHWAEAAHALWPVLEAKLKEENMDALMTGLELPLVPVLCDMERDGFAIDGQRLTAFGRELSEQIAAAETAVYDLAGHTFTIGSPKQLGVVLFEEQGLKAAKKTKTGYSTDAESLEKLRPHPLVEAVLEWRKLTKLRSTYVDGLLQCIGPDGRIHSKFNQMVTATGRLSSTEPNLQNIPVRREQGTEVRRCFLPRPGWVLLDADYSQIELRVLAHIAGDAAMQAAFTSGEDIHTVTAAQVFGVPVEEVTSAERSKAKAVNFGIVYGISAFSLGQDIGTTTREAQAFIDRYLGRYPGVAAYMENIKQQAKEDGYVTTLLHRRREIPELKSSNFVTRSFGERVAMNTPIQGTAAAIIQLAKLRVSEALKREGLRARLILQVHDELIVEAPMEEKERAAALMKREMEGAMALSVPLETEVNWGENWYDAKK